MPRLAGRQKNRENYPHGSVEEYFRRTTFVPSLDDLLVHLNSRFSDGQNDVLSALKVVLPNHASRSDVNEIDKILLYLDDATASEVKAEYLIWCNKWGKENLATEKKHPSISDCLDNCDKSFFPNIHHLLKILATLPGK